MATMRTTKTATDRCPNTQFGKHFWLPDKGFGQLHFKNTGEPYYLDRCLECEQYRVVKGWLR